MTRLEQLASRLPEQRDGALVISQCNRRYLTGFPSSAGWVLVTQNKSYFLTDFRYIEAARRRVRGAECRMVTAVCPALLELCRFHGLERIYVEGSLPVRELTALQKGLPGIAVEAGEKLDGWLSSLRLVKSADELEKIKEAQALTEYGFDHILPLIRPGRTEREIALDLEFLIRRQGAEGVAFDFIVVSGQNSSLPHGVPGDKAVEPGDFVTMDFGAVVDGWHSDMTRTVAVGRASAEQKRVYETVLQAQLAALEALKAGLSCVQGDAAAREIIAAAGYGDCFGHGTGHGVGMEIHEEPRLSPSAAGQILQSGSVVTVEPGIYLPGRFGVRIEDMVYITETGCENLTHCEKGLIELER